MWSSIANLKENLNKIALDVHDDDEDEQLEIYGSSNAPESSGSTTNRRNSHGFSSSRSVSRSPVTNGLDLRPVNHEVEQYKAEIKRLQDSEAEIKALSVNYAALLKEKEDHISRLNQENGSLKHNLSATSLALNTARSDLSNASTKVSGDQSPNRHNKSPKQLKSRNQMYNGVVSKHDGTGSDLNSPGKEKELADLLEEKNRSLSAAQANLELQRKEFKLELMKEREKLANVQQKLQEKHKLTESLHEELNSLRLNKDKTSKEMSKLHNDLNEKIVEVSRLQIELNRRDDESTDGMVGNLKGVIASLETENKNLKLNKSQLETALEKSRQSTTEKIFPEVSESMSNHPNSLNAVPGNFPGKEELELSLQRIEKELTETRRERDKAINGLNRLKQHLLEKESEESDKMDEDSKLIEELRQNNEYQRAQIVQLQKSLEQTIASQKEIKMINNSEIQKSKEVIDDLSKRLGSCMKTIDAKNIELLNLQTALGQYYAEIEAKEHLERELALAREHSAKLTNRLKNAEEHVELSKRENEEFLAKLSQAERTLAEGKDRVKKLEEDNSKLRRALEQSMTRLNRMSVDSDYLVDRRILIKLLITYFQRNHSKEVLDLMVRMLGFSDEEKQRIGAAQQGGRGVVRGVLGLPGRFVGGIMGGNSADPRSNVASDNQSFADLWVDYLLKETEERGRLESQNASKSSEDSNKGSVDVTASSFSPSGFSRPSMSPGQNSGMAGNVRSFEHSDSEFSTVPLTSSDSNSRISRLIHK